MQASTQTIQYIEKHLTYTIFESVENCRGGSEDIFILWGKVTDDCLNRQIQYGRGGKRTSDGRSDDVQYLESVQVELNVRVMKARDVLTKYLKTKFRKF